jgi:hypothetical protein
MDRRPSTWIAYKIPILWIAMKQWACCGLLETLHNEVLSFISDQSYVSSL